MSTSRAPSPMPPAAHQQQLADASSGTPYNTRDAALRGASLAFGKPKVAPKPRPNTYSGNKGALAAARQSSTPQLQPLRPQDTGNSQTSQLSHTSHLGLPAAQSSRARSPSVIAANLAAQRRTPASDSTDTRRRSMMDSSNNTSNDSLPGAGTVSDIRAKFNASAAAPPVAAAKIVPARANRSPSLSSEPTDPAPTQPTASLVKMFEHDQHPAASAPPTVRSPKPAPILTSQGRPPPLKSPKPTRNITVPFASPERSHPYMSKPRPVSAGNIAAKKPKPAPKPAKLLGDIPKSSPHPSPKVPQKPTFGASVREIPASSKEDSDDDAAYMSAPETQTDNRAKPVVPPPRRGTKKATKEEPPTKKGALSSTEPAQVAPLRRQSAAGGTSSAPPPETRALLPPPPISSSYKRSSMKQITPHITGESLADAMVGAALAGSRVPTPSKSPLPPPPRRSGNHHHHHHPPHLFHSHSRDSSPNKKPGKLKPTLRKEPSSSGSESGPESKHKKKRHPLGPKHPNKHAEGTRKRWRDQITEREKKRYEGVWAANRGLYLHPSLLHPSVRRSIPDVDELKDEVVNFVVRDIWNRSRLPAHVLEEVWELVDGRGVGRLRREEFVVGMWLIDQVLKGKKLPVKVQESVWASVKGAGVKVRIRG